MRLTLVTETFAPQVNGVSRTLGQLVDHLERSGDSVQVVHPDYGKPAHRAEDHLVGAWPLPFYREVRVPLPPFGRAHRAIEAFGPDLVHVATEATLGLDALLHLQRRGVPVVSSFHTNFDQYCDHYRAPWAKGVAWRYLRWFHNRTRETYVPSRATIADLEARGFERLILWPRGVDGSLFRPDRPGRQRVREVLGFSTDDLVIGHVSRIAAEKNVGHLARALREVGEARPGVKFLFVGDGPARAGLEAEMGPNARFVGYQGGTDLADHYAACDLFAFASLTETFGNVVLEALASGLPVVAIRAGGVGEIVRPGETGLLVEPGKAPCDLAKALIGLVDDPATRRELAASARLYALTQTWSAIMGRLRDRYLAVAEGPGALVDSNRA